LKGQSALLSGRHGLSAEAEKPGVSLKIGYSQTIKAREELVVPIGKLREFLDAHGVKYEIISHSPAFTAQSIAAAAHIPGRQLAKIVMVKVEGKLAMAVLPASCRIDFALLKETVGADDVQLAHEYEFKDMFPECEVGAMPPFGNLYGLDVYVAEKLPKDGQIAFNAGSHTELMKLDYRDFANLVKPKVVKFAHE
jgi:Ala-tRNA(Pro) deacylase